MKISTVERAIKDAEEFIERAKKALASNGGSESYFCKGWDIKDTSSMKRKSMNLTRTLADLRQGR